MKMYQQSKDIPVIGLHVKTFPEGIQEAFDSLMKNFGATRDYYGISWMDEADNIIYYAMTKQISPSEATQHNYEHLTIKKGDYKTEEVHDWRSKTDCIKDVFHDLMGNNKPTKNNPCIEWYQSDVAMLCMIKADK